MDLSEFREDTKLQKDGTPISMGDATFYVRRFGTPESNKIKKELAIELFGPMHRLQDVDDGQLLAHWLVEYGVASWEGVTDGQQVFEYSKDNARRLFLNPEYSMPGNLNTILLNASMTYENYLFDEAEVAVSVLKKP